MNYDIPILSVPLQGLLDTWAELAAALHGVNGFGGDTAEIYAYTLTPYTPTAHAHGDEETQFYLEFEAAQALAAIVAEFCRRYDCSATIDDMPIARWSQTRFGHRAHIHIIPNDR